MKGTVRYGPTKTLMAEMTAVEVARCEKVLERVQKALDRLDPKLRGSVLANAMGAWIGGHLIIGNPEQSWQLRTDVFEGVIDMIRIATEGCVAAYGLDIKDTFAGKH